MESTKREYKDGPYTSVQQGLKSELIVTLDLINKGYEVFRAMSCNSCDLIALKSGICLRVEVKTKHASNYDPYKSDVLAVVGCDIATIKYYPELEECLKIQNVTGAGKAASSGCIRPVGNYLKDSY